MSEGEAVKFQELVLCTRSDHDEAAPCETEDIKATTTSSRNRKTFCVPDEIRLLASDAAKLQGPREKKTPTQDCPERSTRILAGKAVLPKGKVINRLGRASED